MTDIHKWEAVRTHTGDDIDVYRLSVPGGWIYEIGSSTHGRDVFVPVDDDAMDEIAELRQRSERQADRIRELVAEVNERSHDVSVVLDALTGLLRDGGLGAISRHFARSVLERYRGAVEQLDDTEGGDLDPMTPRNRG